MAARPSVIRPARRADQECVGQLWSDFVQEQAALDARFTVAPDALRRWLNDFPAWLREDDSRLYVAERDEEVVGFVLAHRWTPPPIHDAVTEVFIDHLYVAPEARCRGLGAQLVDAIRAWSTSLRAVRIRLGVLHANPAGQAFWEKQGARPLAALVTIELAGNPMREDKPGRLGF